MNPEPPPCEDSPEMHARDVPEGTLESVVLSVLLQEHRAAQTTLLVLDVVGRLISAGLVIYFGFAANLSVTQMLSGVLVAGMTAIFWQWGRRRAWRTIYGVEETLSRMTGGTAEQVYIESRFIAESGRGAIDRILRFEPALWLYAIIGIVILNVVLGGLSS